MGCAASQQSLGPDPQPDSSYFPSIWKFPESRVLQNDFEPRPFDVCLSVCTSVKSEAAQLNESTTPVKAFTVADTIQANEFGSNQNPSNRIRLWSKLHKTVGKRSNILRVEDRYSSFYEDQVQTLLDIYASDIREESRSPSHLDNDFIRITKLIEQLERLGIVDQSSVNQILSSVINHRVQFMLCEFLTGAHTNLILNLFEELDQYLEELKQSCTAFSGLNPNFDVALDCAQLVMNKEKRKQDLEIVNEWQLELDDLMLHRGGDRRCIKMNLQNQLSTLEEMHEEDVFAVEFLRSKRDQVKATKENEIKQLKEFYQRGKWNVENGLESMSRSESSELQDKRDAVNAEFACLVQELESNAWEIEKIMRKLLEDCESFLRVMEDEILVLHTQVATKFMDLSPMHLADFMTPRLSSEADRWASFGSIERSGVKES